jgi:glucose-6-phosphate isomerase
MAKYSIGQLIKGEIIGVQPYGAFVKLDQHTSGLIHISEISDKFVKSIDDFVKLGDIVTAVIIDYDDKLNQVKLSLKRLNPSEQISKQKRSLSIAKRKVTIQEKAPLFNRLNEYMMGVLIKLRNEEGKLINLDLKYARINTNEFNRYQAKINEIHTKMHNKTAIGSDYLGWLDLPNTYNEREVHSIVTLANELRAKYDTLVVIGIGGSYLGARAVIEAINGVNNADSMKIVYLGNTFSSTYTYQVLEQLKKSNFVVNVISKSGTTTEPALAFRLVKALLVEKYGADEAGRRIIATTDKDRGVLKNMASKEGYQTFVIPDDVGGRYSVLTPVGLLPIAMANINVNQLLLGAKKAYQDLLEPSLSKNMAYQYALTRYLKYNQGYKVELVVSYESQLVMLSEWFKQLFGESEGKGGKGLFPASVNFSTDLHSLGQFVQDGSKILFETIIKVNTPSLDIKLQAQATDYDELNYLAGKTLNQVNLKALEGTLQAHYNEGKVDNLVLELNSLDAYSLGYLLYFLMKTCAMSAYLLEVNPFDQPGVEIYKKNMFKLLGKTK